MMNVHNYAHCVWVRCKTVGLYTSVTLHQSHKCSRQCIVIVACSVITWKTTCGNFAFLSQTLCPSTTWLSKLNCTFKASKGSQFKGSEQYTYTISFNFTKRRYTKRHKWWQHTCQHRFCARTICAKETCTYGDPEVISSPKSECGEIPLAEIWPRSCLFIFWGRDGWDHWFKKSIDEGKNKFSVNFVQHFVILQLVKQAILFHNLYKYWV